MTIKRENYITIQGWMVTDLKLKGNSLLIYAIIYGFSQEEGQRFTGSRQYLADWTNGTKRGVQQVLNNLIETGLLDKEVSVVNGVKYCSYRANKVPRPSEQSSPGVVNKVPQGSEESSSGVVNKVPQGGEQSSPNNTNYITSDNSSDNSSNNNGPSGFVKPTLDEVKAYCEERQRTKGKEKRKPVNPEQFFDHYESNGWKVGRSPMKDWKAAVRNWERNSFNSGAAKPAASSRDTGFETSNPFMEMLNERRGQHDI